MPKANGDAGRFPWVEAGVARMPLIACGVLVLALTACRQPEVQQPHVDTAVQKREDDFRWKERCAAASDRFDRVFSPPQGSRATGDVSVTEVFYSASRNSCVCEVSVSGKSSGKYGVSTLVTLYDCLTREQLAETYLEMGAPATQRLMEQWKAKKAALK